MAYLGIVLFLLVGPALALLGVIKPSLFHRGGWRPGRLKLLGIGVGVAVGGFVLMGVNIDQLRPKPTTAQDAPVPGSPASTAAANPTPAPTPAAAVQEPAKPAIPDDTLAAYCTYTQRSAEVRKEGERRFADITKADEWVGVEVKKLSAQLAEDVGIGLSVLLAHAAENRWEQKCTAMHAGKPLLDAAEVTAATASDATAARNALEGYYVFRLNSERYPLFDRNEYSAIRCSDEVVEQRRFIGCQPISLSKRGMMGVYIVGRSGDGSVQIAPVNGTAMTHIREMPHLKAGETELPVTAYVGPAVDIPRVIQSLD